MQTCFYCNIPTWENKVHWVSIFDTDTGNDILPERVPLHIECRNKILRDYIVEFRRRDVWISLMADTIQNHKKELEK